MQNLVLPRTLLALSRAFEAEALDALHTAGHTKLRRSHYAVFAYIGRGSVRVSDLAERTQQTQQGMGKTLRELEQLGYIRRAIDATDKRAKAISLTASGETVIDLMQNSFTATREQHAELLGQSENDQLYALLEELVRETKLDSPAQYWS
jgi:MarR family transcriptional regulator, temperature-dependent positive regulator of motility